MFMFYGDNLWLYNILPAYLGANPRRIGAGRSHHLAPAFQAHGICPGVFLVDRQDFPQFDDGRHRQQSAVGRPLPVVYLFVSIGLVEIMRGLERLVESHTLRTIPLVLLP
jgi:hypothetical protein